MPSKKKKYNARFPAGRIKKIMQTDEEIGKVAQAVPVIISRTLELFVESLLTKSAQITVARNAKTLTPSHMKQCILSENRFDFLKDLVKYIPDATTQEDGEGCLEIADCPSGSETPTLTSQSSIIASTPATQGFVPNFYTEQSTSNATPVIQFGSTSIKTEKDSHFGSMSIKTEKDSQLDLSIKSLPPKESADVNIDSKIHIDLTNIIRQPCPDVPPLMPLSHNSLYQGNNDNLCIDEDYDNC